MVSTASPARRVAFRVLRDVEDRRGDPAALLHAPRQGDLSGPDRDLATEITYGVLRWRNLLDFVIAEHSRRPLGRIDPVPLLALRMGLYQLRFLTRVPARAAVDESVRLVQAFGTSSAAPFVNAVLRSAARAPERPRLPDRSDPLPYLVTTLSHPEWLASRYLERLGFDGAEARCRIQNETPPLYLRASPSLSLDEARESLQRDGVSSEPVALAPHAVRVVDGSAASVRASSIYRAGLVSIQDAGSQLVAALVEPRPDDVVLDVCAAPGGKTLAVAEPLSGGHVLALDRRHRRSLLVRELAMRLRATNVWVVTADGTHLPVSKGFSHILLDVPCSSLGTLRRNPDVKWRAAPADLSRHAAIQTELLERGADRLAAGGRLVYATCSTEPEENEQVVRAFLSARPGFRIVPPARLANDDGFFETRPERDGTDGFFAAILTRD